MPLPALWPHQGAAIQFTLNLWLNGRPGVLLACAMGVGKTRMAIELIRLQHLDTVLILCPLRVVEVWGQQLEEYAGFPYRFLALDTRAGTIQKKAQAAHDALARKRPEERLIIAINYESGRVEPFATWARHTVWDLVIADECHRIKGNSSVSSRFAGRLALNARRRLGLSGTPFAHSPLDIWAQYRFLDRTIFDPTFTSFKTRYAILGGFQNHQVVAWRDLDELKKKFRSIAYQVANDVLELPGEMDQAFFTELEPEARRIYRNLERDLLAWLEEQGALITAKNALVRLLRLQQVTGGTIRDEISGIEHQVSSAKELLLEDLLEDLPEEEPVVVFANFRSDLAAIHRVAQRLKRASGELSGSSDSLARWRRGGKEDPVILAVQMQAGSEGIDLTRAHYGIYYSTGFSLALYLQSRARLYRPGQTRPVAFYHLAIRDSIDERIQKALAARADLIEAVLAEFGYHRQGASQQFHKEGLCKLPLQAITAD